MSMITIVLEFFKEMFGFGKSATDLAAKRSDLNNAPDIKAAEVAGDDQKTRDAAAEALRKKDLDKVREGLS